MGWKITKDPPAPKEPHRRQTFTGSQEEWEKSRRELKQNRYLIEVWPDEEFAAKWRDLPPPDYSWVLVGGKRVSWTKDATRQRQMIWHSQCLPLLTKAIKAFGTQEDDIEVPFKDIAKKMEELHGYKKWYVSQKLSQLWKGGLIRRFIRSNSYRYSKKVTTGGANYGVHYILRPPEQRR